MMNRLTSKTFIFALAAVAILACGGIAFGQAVQTGSSTPSGATPPGVIHAIGNAMMRAGYVQSDSTALAGQVETAIAAGLPPGIAVSVIKQALRGGENPSQVFETILSNIASGMSPGQAANFVLGKGNQGNHGHRPTSPGQGNGNRPPTSPGQGYGHRPTSPGQGSGGTTPSQGGGQTSPSTNSATQGSSGGNNQTNGSNHHGNSGNGHEGNHGQGNGQNKKA